MRIVKAPPTDAPISSGNGTHTGEVEKSPNRNPTKPPAKSPANTPVNTGGRPSLYVPNGELIENVTYKNKYARAFMRKEDGTADESRSVVVCITQVTDKATGQTRPVNTVIWEGDLGVTERALAYDITPARTLKAPEWQTYVKAWTITNAPGAKRVTSYIPGMALNQPKQHANWMDRLNITLSGQSFRVAEMFKILALEAKPTVIIHGQGPVYLTDDDSPEPGDVLNGKLVFATRSGVFDTNGDYLPIATDLKDLPSKANYYDLTPVTKISEEEIRRGISLFAESFDECRSGYAAIPAAFIGQLYTGWLAPIKIDYWSGLLLTGEKGSGKTYLCLRYDSIQARDSERTRGTLTELKPVINLGDMTGTNKGTKYVVTNFGGYTVTADDVLKKGASDIEIRNQALIVSNLIRSMESGGAALGKVDRANNRVIGSESPALHSSIRFPSEIPIPRDSTMDRMVYLPHITETWNKGTGSIFDLEIALKLSEGYNREYMHRAYSAFVHWAFQRINTDAEESLSKGKAITSEWGIPSRTRDRYAALLAGLFLYERFANAHSIDVAPQIARAIIALRDCAREQSGANVPVGQQWATELRRLIAIGKAAFPGPPATDISEAIHNQSYSGPAIVTEKESESGIKTPVYEMPWEGATLDNFGIPSSGTINNTPIYGYVLPPISKLPGRPGKKRTDPFANKWRVAIRREQFNILCEQLSRNYGYEPETVKRSLTDMGLGELGKECIIPGKQERVFVFDVSLIKPDNDDDGSEE
jgi:hypothetical protein